MLGREEVVFRNGCVNRISSQHNSVQYFLFYLEEAFRIFSARKIGRISGVIVSLIFHILVLLFITHGMLLNFTDARSVDSSRDSICSRREFERTFDRTSYCSSISASFFDKLDVAGSNPIDIIFFRSSSLHTVSIFLFHESVRKRGFRVFSCCRSKVFSRLWSRCVWICDLMQAVGKTRRQDCLYIERWIIESLSPSELYHYFLFGCLC